MEERKSYERVGLYMRAEDRERLRLAQFLSRSRSISETVRKAIEVLIRKLELKK